MPETPRVKQPEENCPRSTRSHIKILPQDQVQTNTHDYASPAAGQVQ